MYRENFPSLSFVFGCFGIRYLLSFLSLNLPPHAAPFPLACGRLLCAPQYTGNFSISLSLVPCPGSCDVMFINYDVISLSRPMKPKPASESWRCSRRLSRRRKRRSKKNDKRRQRRKRGVRKTQKEPRQRQTRLESSSTTRCVIDNR